VIFVQEYRFFIEIKEKNLVFWWFFNWFFKWII